MNDRTSGTTDRRRDALLPVALALACYALALVQRPGLAVSDTKIDLHVDPVRFLADAFAPWSDDVSLGHVQSGQYGGYVFPMGPFFALFRLLGVSPWVTERLWLGTVYALGAWGVVRLLDALYRRERGVAHVVAAAVFVLNPYVVTYTSRTSISLLAYALLPWLLLFVHRGLRDGRGWVWPAAFALGVTASGGGVNAAVTFWVLVGPLLLLAYEPAAGATTWAQTWRFTWRALVLGLVTSLWWVVPLLVQAKWGLPFLQYTEQPGTIWQTTSATESLRLLGFWLSYAGVGYGGTLVPYLSSAGVMVFFAPVVVATLLVPALSLGGYAWTRRWRYGPFLLLMALVGVLVMIAGFPEGTPLRHGLNFVYNRAGPLQFLRTTYKAGPLVALPLALLGGVGAAVLWRWLAARGWALGRVALGAGAAAVIALAAWPLVRGKDVESQLTFKRVPAAWKQAADDLDRGLGGNHRAMILPGQLFSAYTWGATVDPILPALARKPVAVRQVVPFADLRSVDLQWATDALVTQRRALPGQLRPLLALQGVGAVVTGADDDRARSGALGANAAARELALAGFGRPDAAYGPRRRIGAQAGDLAPPVRLPQVRRYDVTGRPGGRDAARPAAADGMVRLLPRGRPTVVDGGADGVLGLAAFGQLRADEPLRYAADLTPAQLRAAAAAGGRIVITDSNRRRVFVPSRLRGNQGATLAPGDPISADGHQLDPWPGRGTAAQTVAVLHGVRYVRAPFSPQVTQFPEHRPVAALDGDPATAWLADRTLDADRWHLDVGFEGPRDVRAIRLLPYGDARGHVRAVTVNGRRFAVHDGWNRLRVDLHGVSELSIAMVDVTNPPAGVSGGAGGIRELRIPGVRPVDETLRLPELAERALRGADTSHAPLAYLFQRATGDDPFHRAAVHGPWQAGLVRDQGDAETGLERTFAPPAARTWTVRGWVSLDPRAPDPLLDRLAGVRGGRFASSTRFQAPAGHRASSAFDGAPGTAWVGGWIGPAPGARALLRGPADDESGAVGAAEAEPGLGEASVLRAAAEGRGAWLSWTTPRRATVQRFTLVPTRLTTRRPTLVRLVTGRARSPAVRVARDGTVRLPEPLTGRRFRLDILDAAFPPGASGVVRQRRAVGIAGIRGPGIPRVHVPRAGAIDGRCTIRTTIGGRAVRLRPAGTIAALDAGRPLRAVACGGAIALPAAATRLSAPPSGGFRVDDLELASPAPQPLATTAAAAPGRVLDPGEPGRGSRDGIRLAVTAPAWLTIGESWSAGWRATCDGRSLGDPVPLQGYAAAWPVDRGCTDVSVTFAGNTLTTVAALVSLVAALALLGLIAVRLPRRPRPAPPDAAPLPETDPPARLSLRRALALGVAAAVVGGFVFALRAGVVIGPLVALILWRGIGARALSLAAGGLLGIAVPILYLAVPAEDKGGYNTNAPLEHIAAHWVGVAAIVLLIVALYRTLAGVRALRARSPSASTPSAAAHCSARTTAA